MAWRFSLVALLWSLLGIGSPSYGEELTATLTLDGLSFVSFQDREVYSIPAGSTVRFNFGTPSLGSVSLAIKPSDVDMGPLTLRDGKGTMRFGLSQGAIGSARLGNDGVIMELVAEVVVTLLHPEQGGSKKIRLLLTTESAEGWNLGGTDKVSLTGMRMSPIARAIQLVGATTNAANDFPEPGAAVKVVLSGAFDKFPSLR